jgi:rubrerythrin
MSDDLIKRSDAISACAYETIECYEARKAIRALPSADRPQGEWKSVKASIYPFGYDVECSICGHRMGSSFGYKFCPMCGARMKGADGE